MIIEVKLSLQYCWEKLVLSFEGPAPIQEAKIVENGSLSNAIQVQEPRWDNSANRLH